MRPVRFRRWFLLPVVVTAAVLALPAAPSVAARGATVKAVVVRSWGACGSGSLIWDDLNSTWSSYGSVPISIDYSNPSLCTGAITYQSLVDSGADVVIISDAAGGTQQYQQSEIDAIQQYAAAGHNVIGTYLSFFWGSIDDRGLAPMFGIKKSASYLAGQQGVTPTYDVRWPGSPLFRGLPDPYVSSGYPNSQVPVDGAWSSNEIQFGQLAGRTSDARAIVQVRTVGESARNYISSMPEFVGGTQDKQFFYNAIIYQSFR
jgi:hypothetical protein